MNAVNKRQALFSRQLGSSFIGKQHHFLNDAFALSTGTGNNIHTNSIFIEKQRTFCCFNLRRTTPFPLCHPNVTQFIHNRNHMQYCLILFQQLR